ncbi:MAG: hypothetical protein ABR568_09720 [Pyrinomonadaceae bacterium]
MPYNDKLDKVRAKEEFIWFGTKGHSLKHKSLQLMLLLGLALSGSLAYGQGSLGPSIKKARTLEDYQPGTLKNLAAKGSERDGLIPFRVRVTFKGSTRPISKTAMTHCTIGRSVVLGVQIPIRNSTFAKCSLLKTEPFIGCPSRISW